MKSNREARDAEFYGSLLFDGGNPDMQDGTPEAQSIVGWFRDAFPVGRFTHLEEHTDAQIINRLMWGVLEYAMLHDDRRRN